MAGRRYSAWLGHREVLLPVSALRPPDPVRHHFQVKPATQQVKSSPEIDTGRSWPGEKVPRSHDDGRARIGAGTFTGLHTRHGDGA